MNDTNPPTAAALRAAKRLTGDKCDAQLIATARIIDEEFSPVIDALKEYRKCRHGNYHCNCTKEAKAVLFGVSD